MPSVALPTDERSPEGPRRYHAFDALRAAMMLLGPVIHAACSYCTVPTDAEWPYKDSATSQGFDLVLVVIHAFRMPVFFCMAGFFAALLYERRGAWGFVQNRAARVLVPFVLGYLLLVPLVRQGFYFAQAAAAGDTAALASSFERALRVPFEDVTAHLWFLYYLLYFCASSVLVLRWVPEHVRQPAGEAARRWMTRPWRTLPFALVFGSLCASMQYGALGTSVSFVPNLAILGAYASFYVFGWLLWGSRQRLDDLRQGVGWRAAVALSAFVVHLVCVGRNVKDVALGLTPWVAVAAYAGALSAWFACELFIGLFLRHLDHERRWVRYLTDASYWVYLIHLPLVIFTAGALAQVNLGAASKASIVLGASMVASLVSYEWLVRDTFIGTLLSGRRYPPSHKPV
jgi:glucans biosynthesis protein C